jgi:hypothetical protein
MYKSNYHFHHFASKLVQFWQEPKAIYASFVYHLAHTKFRFWFYPAYWRFFMITLLQHKKKEIMTNQRYIAGFPNLGAGIGHQLVNWNSTLILSRKYNLQFVHTSLEKAWEDFLGFGGGEIQYSSLVKEESIQVVNLPRIHSTGDIVNFNTVLKEDPAGDKVFDGIINLAYLKSNVLFCLQGDQKLYDQTVTADYLRDKYWNQRSKNPMKSSFDCTRVNIAVHVRRGDVVQWKKDKVGNYQARYVDNLYFINILKQIMKTLQGKPISIHLYSQGELAQFSDFKVFTEMIFHIDEDVFQTFHDMVCSDILVMSPSDFSYMAGIISKGTKIAKFPFWHHIPENYEWIHANNHGEFNSNTLSQTFN